MKNWKAPAFHENQKLAGARLEQIQHVEGYCWILFQSFYLLVSETEDWRETEKQPRSVFYVCTVMSDSLQPHGLQPTRLLCPWDFPARILERGAISSSRGSSLPTDQTVSWSSCTGSQALYHWATQMPINRPTDEDMIQSNITQP